MARTALDMTTWPRRAHFGYFRSLPCPWVGVTQMVDVTELKGFCRERGVSFFLAMLHAAALAADGVAAFRQRIHAGGVVEYDACPTSHTELLPDGTYCYCTVRHDMPFDQYLLQAEEARRRSREAASIEEDEDAESMYFVSCLPWLHYTALTQPTGGGDESNPRITWGKYEPDARGRLMLPVTALVHHALADGLHLGQFYANLDRIMDELIHGRL